jgi:NitT/TauT family transport system substrate-binding protein
MFSTVRARRFGRYGPGVVAIAAVSLLAACSSGGGSSSSPSAASGTSSASAASTKTIDITVGDASGGIGNAPLWIGEALGYFKDEGINIHEVTLSSSSVAMPSLVSGSIDFAFADSLAVMTAVSQNLPVKASIGLTYGVPGFALVVSPQVFKSAGLVAGDVNGDLKKLAGKKIAVQATTSTSGHIIAGLLSDAGLPKTQFSYVTIPSSSEATSLAHGLIDGFFQNVPVPQEAVASGTGMVAFATSSVPRLQNVLYNTVVSSTKFLNSNPDGYARFKAAIVRAQKDLADKNPAAIKAVDAHLKNIPLSTVNPYLSTGVDTDGSLPVDKFQAMVDAANAWKMTKAPLTSADVTASLFTGSS